MGFRVDSLSGTSGGFAGHTFHDLPQTGEACQATRCFQLTRRHRNWRLAGSFLDADLYSLNIKAYPATPVQSRVENLDWNCRKRRWEEKECRETEAGSDLYRQREPAKAGDADSAGPVTQYEL